MLFLLGIAFSRFGERERGLQARRALHDLAKVFAVLTAVCSLGVLTIEWMGWEERFSGLGVLAMLLLSPGALPDDADARSRVLASMADQVETLMANLETHLLGMKDPGYVLFQIEVLPESHWL